MEVKVGWMRVLIEAQEYLKLPPFFSLPISLFFYSKITVLSQNQFLNLKRFFVKCLGKFSLQKVQKKENRHQIRNRTLHHITNILHASKIRFEIVDWSNTEDGTKSELQISHLTSFLSLLLLHLTLWVQFLIMEHVLSCHFQIMLLLLQKLTFQMWCPFSRKFVKLSLHYSLCLPPTPASHQEIIQGFSRN